MRLPIWTSSVLLAVMTALSATIASADAIYAPPSLPTQGGKPIDRCVNDGVRNNCDAAANRIAANEFCRATGNQDAVSWIMDTTNVVPKPAKRAAKTLQGSLQWVDIMGLHTFTKITCASDSRDSREFISPVRNGMRIDRCVQGADWGLLDPQRCDSFRESYVARTFCVENGYPGMWSYKKTGHTGNHAILTYPKGTDFRNGTWTQVVGNEVIQSIVCNRNK